MQDQPKNTEEAFEALSAHIQACNATMRAKGTVPTPFPPLPNIAAMSLDSLVELANILARGMQALVDFGALEMAQDASIKLHLAIVAMEARAAYDSKMAANEPRPAGATLQ